MDVVGCLENILTRFVDVFFDVSGSFCMVVQTAGCFGNLLDTLDVVGCFWTYLDVSGRFEKFFGCFEAFLDVFPNSSSVSSDLKIAILGLKMAQSSLGQNGPFFGCGAQISNTLENHPPITLCFYSSRHKR